MDLRQLRSLVAIAEEGQFTRAAARVGIAQSSLSAQIRLLEQELGLSLFDRTTRRVSLTGAGESLLASARVVLGELEDVTAGLRERHELLAGRVTLGVTQTPGPIDVVGLLAEFHRQHPGIDLSVREDLSVDLAHQLRDDRLDMAILTIVEPEHRHGLELLPLAEEQLVAVLPPGHPLAAREQISMAQLREESFVVSPPGATIRSAVIRAAAEAGFTPRVAFESREVSRIRAIVAAGLGVAFLPRSDAQSPGAEVTWVELEGEYFTHTLSLGWRARRHQSPAATALLAHARRAGELPAS